MITRDELSAEAKRFYQAEGDMRFGGEGEWDSGFPELVTGIVERYFGAAEGLRILELGCGRSPVNRLSSEYVGLDIGWFPLRRYLAGSRAVQADMTVLPLRPKTVDVVVSFRALEHVPAPDLALDEIHRVLRPGGLAILAPAWFCRRWVTKGLNVMRSSELGWRDRIEKALLPVTEQFVFRSFVGVCLRALRELRYRSCDLGTVPFEYGRLTPNLDEYIQPDSDACASIDPHAMLLHFQSLGYEVEGGEHCLRRMLWRGTALVARKPFDAGFAKR
jgi:SAM-dependent methyltransferase